MLKLKEFKYNQAEVEFSFTALSGVKKGPGYARILVTGYENILSRLISYLIRD
uniref:Uncharacterized protein n=1 Tax=uncultured bacterium ws172H5 TaxID=1131829 RepID=I1X4W2_9BACT|nr:hypothetical protein ws172H5_0031 [uncultured bacterium ws172H5]